MTRFSTTPGPHNEDTASLTTVQDTFDRFESSSTVRDEPAWLTTLRKNALATFLATGYPTRKDDNWRHTSLTPLAALPFNLAPGGTDDSRTRQLVASSTFNKVAGPRLVFVNGRFVFRTSTNGFPAEDPVATNLAAVVRSRPGLVEPRLTGQVGTAGDGSFCALNLAFLEDGAVITVPPDTVVANPVVLLFLSLPKTAGDTCQPRNLVIAGRNSRVTVIEHYLGLGETPSFTNAVTDLFADEGAVVEHVKLQDETCESFHIATLRAQLASASNVICHSIALGARLSRQNIRAILAGNGSEGVFNGLFLGHQDRLVDHHLAIDHAEPACTSREFFNGVLADSSKGVFYGRIHVRPHAQKTDAKQTNKNLLLSDLASVHTRPQLEIYADDVKCTHGATIGQLDPDAVFYLRSRGLPIKTARRMLIHAFAGEIIDRVRCEPAREALHLLVQDRIERTQHVGTNA